MAFMVGLIPDKSISNINNTVSTLYRMAFMANQTLSLIHISSLPVTLPRIFMPRPVRRFMEENTPRLKQVLPMVSVRCVEMFFHKEIWIPTGPWSVRGERCFRKDFSEDF